MATSYLQASDPYAGFQSGLDSRGVNCVAVTPSDTVDFVSYPKSLVVTVAGNLVVLPLKAPDDGVHLITFTSVAAGFVLPFRVRRVMSTSTTASVAAVTD